MSCVPFGLWQLSAGLPPPSPFCSEATCSSRHSRRHTQARTSGKGTWVTALRSQGWCVSAGHTPGDTVSEELATRDLPTPATSLVRSLLASFPLPVSLAPSPHAQLTPSSDYSYRSGLSLHTHGPLDAEEASPGGSRTPRGGKRTSSRSCPSRHRQLCLCRGN